jgi:hypothetical protein
MTEIPNTFRTLENSNFDIVSDFELIAWAMLRSVLRDSGFDVSRNTLSYGATSSNYFWDVILVTYDPGHPEKPFLLFRCI